MAEQAEEKPGSRQEGIPAADTFPGVPGWRRSACLGCGERVVAARHAHVLIGGRRDGTALLIIGLEADRAMAEEPDALMSHGDTYLLGVAHRPCVDQARRQLRLGRVPLPADLPLLRVEDIDELPE